MFRRKKKPTERLPWYRERNFKGNLTENEKRQLNSFRMRESHPAATNGSLPEEVQRYISSLEMEVYDRKQGSLVGGCLVVSVIGAFFLVRYIVGYQEGSFWAYTWALCLLVLPWIYYPIQWRKNADEFCH